MPQTRVNAAKVLRDFGAGRSLALLAVIFLLGLLGTFALPHMLDGFSGGAFGLGFFLAMSLIFAYVIVYVIPKFLLAYLSNQPQPFPLVNGTDRKKVKRFKVAAKCKDGSTAVPVDMDFTQPPYDPNQCLGPHEHTHLTLDTTQCDPAKITFTVVVENADGSGGETTCTSGPIAVEVGGDGPCTIEIVERRVEDASDPQLPPRNTVLSVHMMCDGEPPVDQWIDLECQ